jgi:Pyruvate/2-oxoacid:ferredoxin oxidoreductase delta subunit
MKFGKIFFPGLSGITLWLAAVVLSIKGYKIVGLRPIDLPSNWISLHPGLRGNAVIQIYERCRKITEKFAGDILNNKKNYRAFYDIIQDLFISPVSIGYFLAGRFMFAKSFYANSSCDKCYTCVNNCPVQAIKLINEQPYWTVHCESCMKCMNECPKRAVETGHGFIIGLFILTNSVILIQLWDYIFNFVKLSSHYPLFNAATLVIDTVIYFILLFISYRMIHSLKRFPVFKQAIEYTSLTKYQFWGRYNVKKIFSAGKKN